MTNTKAAFLATCVLTAGAVMGDSTATTNTGDHMVRLAKLTIDPAQLDTYKAALKEEIEDSIRLEPGVLTLYAVSENDHPTQITILEIYESRAAYERHIKSPHFLKYKTGTQQMVKALELIEATPLVPEMKTPR